MKYWNKKEMSFPNSNLINELRFEPDDYRNSMRISKDMYSKLLGKFNTLVGKKYPTMSEAAG